MHSFESEFLEKQPLSHAFLRTVRLLGEYRGKEWWEYFLGVMLLGAYHEFERRTGELTSAHGAKRELIIDVIGRLPDTFRVADIERACPGVSRPAPRSTGRFVTLDRPEGSLA